MQTLVNIKTQLRRESNYDYWFSTGKYDQNKEEIEVQIPKALVLNNGDGTWKMPEWLAFEKELI